MYTLAQGIHYLFPLIAFLLLIIGIHKNAIYYIISALWLSLIALIIHHQISGGEILGSYFNYANAAIYTINLVILFIALIRVIAHLTYDNPALKYASAFIQAFVVICSLLVITNLWINAYFIENRMAGTPIMQVGLFEKADYCEYRYVFYKVNTDGAVMYLCPNHYGLIPSIGRLTVNPDFITTQLKAPVKKHMFLLRKPKN